MSAAQSGPPPTDASRPRRSVNNRYDTFVGSLYDFGIEHERVGRVVGRLLEGGDIQSMYASMGAIAKVPAGGTILDVPCGGGVAFRALDPGQEVRYLAVDLSEHMLERAKALARRRGLGRVDFIRADIESLPIEDESVDLCLCYNSLHCFRDPAAALAEMARCIKPGGRLVATTTVRGCGRRSDLLVRLFQLQGTFGPGGTEHDYRNWMSAAGLTDLRVEPSGAYRLIEARK